MPALIAMKKFLWYIDFGGLTNPLMYDIIVVPNNKGDNTMKYRAYNETNWSERMGFYLATYFRTKREAVAHASAIGGDAKVERKVGSNWYPCEWTR